MSVEKSRLPQELQRRDGWKGSGVRFEVDESAIGKLASDGHQVQYGARPLARELEARITAPLSEAICDSGRLAKLSVTVGVKGKDDREEIALNVTAQPRQSRVTDDSAEGMIQQMTLLRRRSQALDRCVGTHDLCIRHTQGSKNEVLHGLGKGRSGYLLYDCRQ